MKWKAKPKPFVGQKKIVKKFLIFPRKADEEWRWLEWATIEMQYVRDHEHDFRFWSLLRFADEEGAIE